MQKSLSMGDLVDHWRKRMLRIKIRNTRKSDLSPWYSSLIWIFLQYKCLLKSYDFPMRFIEVSKILEIPWVLAWNLKYLKGKVGVGERYLGEVSSINKKL